MNLHFDLIAPLYDKVIPPPDPAQLAQVLRLPIDGWMLDAGGGTGRVASTLRPLVSRLVITDLSAAMLGQAQAKGLACPVQAQVERLPFPDGSFDRVLVVDALHHFADQWGAIAELVRVLRPGGRLVIEEPDIGFHRVKLIALAEKLAMMQSRFHAPDAIAAMAAAHGVEVSVLHNGWLSAWVIADKP